MSIFFQQHFQDGATTSGGGGCPTITLADLSSDIAYMPVAYSDSAAASGGEGPYTYAVTAGVLPDGLSLNTNTGAITGAPTTFGESQTFTITATDSNLCTGEKEYTVDVWAMFINDTPTPIVGNDVYVHNVVVSDMPTVYGTGFRIDNVELNIDYDGLENLSADLNGPEDGYNLFFGLSGNNLVNTKIDTTVSTVITEGTAPYTGTFNGTGSVSGFNAFNGQDPNFTWQVIVTNVTTDSGSINSVIITFKPI